MLDSQARHWIQPWLNTIARFCIRIHINANTLSVIALLVGLWAAILVADGHNIVGLALLWASGLLDASDGTLARMTYSSPLGAILDITLDRVVEVSIIVALAYRFPDTAWVMVVLAGTIAVAMSLFLSIGAAVANTSVKSFHYAPGLGERTEAFLCFSLMILDPMRLVVWSWVFIGLMVITMLQRLHHVHKILAKDHHTIHGS